MNKILSAFIFLFISAYGFGQCMVEPLTLQTRIQQSGDVLEGKVILKKSYYNHDRSFIYTLNTIEVYRVFKGNISAKTIEVITDGGQIGNEMITAHPSLEFQLGNVGILMLRKGSYHMYGENTPQSYFEGVASVQSFILYDLDEQAAHDYLQIYMPFTTTLYPEIQGITKEKLRNIHAVNLDPWAGKIRPLAPPVISSWSHDTISAGTQSVLTINGSNFGAERGNGNVQFVDANFGDGRFFVPEYRTSYKSWSDTKIEVYVPSRAGTGNIKVVNNGNESGFSSKKLQITFSHLNSTYGDGSIDTQYFVTDHVDDNGKGGYSWQMHTKFKQKTTAVNSFMRSLENWRCGTLMNWDVGNETSVNTISRDNVNLVRLTKFTDSKLGVCYSYWSGCSSGANIIWYVAELDIEFDSSRNWYYGTGTPSGTQMDFESVSTHELGHGHQLGHVIDSKKIMHYSIGNGERKTVLHANDLEGGKLCMTRSTQNNICGPSKLVALAQNKCSITKPTAGFTISKSVVCPKDDITVTDSSEGVISTYTWNFGLDASPAIGNGIGPHTFNYSTPGVKTVSLIVVNSFGTDTFTREITVEPAAPANPVPFAHEDSVCKGTYTYTIPKVPDATSYLWMLSGGGSIVGANTDTTLTVKWLITGGPHEARVVALNSCGNSATVALPVTVFDKAVAGFTQSVDGRTVTFTNTSTHADSFQWYFGDGDSAIVKDPVHTYPHATTYNISLRAMNFCSESEKAGTAQTVNGAQILKLNAGMISGYPNPASGEWYVDLTQLQGENIVVEIAELSGKVLQRQPLKALNINRLDLSSLSAGQYLMNFSNGEQKQGTLRLIKQ